MINEKNGFNYIFYDYVIKRLQYRNKPYWYDYIRNILKQIPKENEWYIKLHMYFNLEESEDKFVADVNTEDLPF